MISAREAKAKSEAVNKERTGKELVEIEGQIESAIALGHDSIYRSSITTVNIDFLKSLGYTVLFAQQSYRISFG